jgi:hypothetical protein
VDDHGKGRDWRNQYVWGKPLADVVVSALQDYKMENREAPEALLKAAEAIVR